jgi:anti-sigma B factor antagonist
MQIQTRRQDDVAIIELAGRLTINDRPGELRDAVAQAVADGARHILLDLSGVRYVDSTRLGELIGAHISVSRHGGRLKLAGTPARIVELLAIAGLDGIFERFDSVDEATASLV